ncbi:MAG: hypothetical protein FWG70_07245 [Oscillospiraceae bacterium]|nr:hypothetical protein [Oscillospiraceae bacterium]
MAKKLLCVILAMCMIFALTACESNEGGSPATTPQPVDLSSGNDGETDPTDGGETPADGGETPTDGGTAPTDGDALGIEVAPATQSDREWPDLREYFPFDYDQSKVIYATSFEDESEICTCEDPVNDSCDALWQRRWDAQREVNFEGAQVPVIDAYGVQLHELVPGGIVGSTSLLSGNRALGWTGAIANIYDLIDPGTIQYEAFAWVKMPDDASPGRVVMSHETRGADGPNYGYWDDFDGPEGIYSKYFLPIGTPDMARNPDHATFYEYPEGYTNDGWVLLHGTFPLISVLYDEIFFYFEVIGGNALQQDVYIDCLVIIKAD